MPPDTAFKMPLSTIGPTDGTDGVSPVVPAENDDTVALGDVIVYHCSTEAASYTADVVVGRMTAVFAALPSIALPTCGYTFSVLRPRLTIVILVPGTATGNITPVPAATVDTTLNEVVIEAAPPWVAPVAVIAVVVPSLNIVPTVKNVPVDADVPAASVVVDASDVPAVIDVVDAIEPGAMSVVGNESVMAPAPGVDVIWFAVPVIVAATGALPVDPIIS